MNLKKIGKVFTSKFVGTGPSSYETRIYRVAVSQRLRNTGLGERHKHNNFRTASTVGGLRFAPYCWMNIAVFCSRTAC